MFKGRAAHTCSSKMPKGNSTPQASRGSTDPLEPVPLLLKQTWRRPVSSQWAGAVTIGVSIGDVRVGLSFEPGTSPAPCSEPKLFASVIGTKPVHSTQRQVEGHGVIGAAEDHTLIRRFETATYLMRSTRHLQLLGCCAALLLAWQGLPLCTAGRRKSAGSTSSGWVLCGQAVAERDISCTGKVGGIGGQRSIMP